MLSNKANSFCVYMKIETRQLFLNLIDNAPASLDTLNELAAALADDATYASVIQNLINNKADKSTTYTKTEAHD